MSDEAGFLARWARRKRAALRGEAPGEPSVLPEVADQPGLDERPSARGVPDVAMPLPGGAVLPEALAPEVPAASSEVEVAEGEPFDVGSLPPVELLDAASDFSAFLKPGVPAALRSAALRKAWTADPLIRDYLSPLDYGWDFNTPGGLPFGFSDALGEGAEKVMQLVRQAIGEPEPPPDSDAPPPEPAPESVPLEELPADAVPMAEASPPELVAAPAEPAEPPRRRHGGALPA